MLLKRFYDTKLAQASYLVGCQATGDAIVVDPNRDLEQYVAAAKEEGVRITHVTETHIHADFVSGSRELAERTGAKLLLSDEGGDDWRYAFATSSNAELLHGGDVVMIGNIRLDVIHTPGHTPEHIVFVVTDTRATNRAMGILSGDFLFVGDVGRPDLLERAANIKGTMEVGARTLFHSLQRLKELPDYLQVWPGHGAGSACGKALGAVPSTTLGYERIANWALGVEDESSFVATVLEGQPEPPKYFADMKRINREGPSSLGGFTRPASADARALKATLDGGALIVDTRPAAAFAKRHVPGTINIPLNRSFSNWAGSLIPFEREFHLIVDDAHVDEAVRDLAMIGLDRVASYFGTESIDVFENSGGTTGTTQQLGVRDLASQIKDGTITTIDVRARSEWNAGHIAGVPNIPLGALPDRLAEIPRDTPIALHCQGGGRSAIAASILKANGFENVVNVTGGFDAWEKEGLAHTGN